MIGRWKFAFVVLALPLILFAQTSHADSDQDYHRNRHKRHRQHHRSPCPQKDYPNTQLAKLPIPQHEIDPSFKWPWTWYPTEQKAYTPILGGSLCSNTIPVLRQVAPGREECFARLFKHENGACNIHTVINPKKGKNPAWGLGLCTIEMSPALRIARGPACSDVNSYEGQVKCCVHLYDSTDGKYFGPVLRGDVPRCG